MAKTVSLALASVASALSFTLVAAPRTFCNPMPLENYPLGLFCRGMVNGTKPPKEPETWVSDDRLVHQFRELADPSLLWENGTWYVFPSADLCWRSKDLGGTWEHVPLHLSGADGEKDQINYAPTVCKHRGKYLLIGGAGHVFQADRPEGPFKDLGELKLPRWGKDWNWLTGNPPALWDPNYFSDDDGKLYFYWGCSPTNGIWGVEMDSEDPLKLVSVPKKLIAFEPRTQPWEIAPGKSPEMGYLEGPWMIKRDGKYILTYAAAGTENKEYAMGQALSDKPLGTFVKPKNNPFFRKTTGFITGTSHGSVAQGPDGTWWVAYTINANCVHWFERRIGFDRIDFEPDGSLKVTEATDTPQWLPGHGTGATGWKRLVAKSSEPQATDLKFKTYWQPEKLPASVEVTFNGLKTVRAYRLIWHDGDLDTENGVKKGPFRYGITYQATDGSWKLLVDEGRNTHDRLVDYRETEAVQARALRLVVLGGPKGIKPGVVDFSPFGD